MHLTVDSTTSRLRLLKQRTTQASVNMPAQPPPSIKVNNLSYAFPDGSTGLQNVSIDLPAGARCLLIGGKHLLSDLLNDMEC